MARPRRRGVRSPLRDAATVLALAPLLVFGLLVSAAGRLPPRVVVSFLAVLAAGALAALGVLAATSRLSLAQTPLAPATRLVPLAQPAPTATAEPCRFVTGFAALHDQIPDVVGECVDGERADPLTGDTVQRTSRGLLVWRKVDNAAAFTDGQATWLIGPHGLAYRPNTIRFPWEVNTGGLPVLPEGHPSITLPGALLPAQRIVTYYGNPMSPLMGILGQRTPDQMMAALDRQAQQYAAADPKTPVLPALHLVATVATDTPGPDGMYRRRSKPEEIEQVAQWAESKGWLLILDIQPGRSPFGAEVEAVLPYLTRPYVHLAVDPEWSMGPNQVPGTVFGSTDAAAVNDAIQTLARLVSRHRLPPKLLIVHRFRDDMLTNSQQIRPDPRVQVVVMMDGVGGQWVKSDIYRQVVHDQPVQYAGFKIFYTQDINPFTPKQVVDFDPAPYVVAYQ